MKPHDERWVREGSRVVSQERADAGYERVVGRAASYQDADIFAAAPDMARALMRIQELVHRASALRAMLGEERCAEIAAAIDKAGIQLS
jgi:hypothetical protein